MSALAQPLAQELQEPIELSVIMPCLNEQETVGTCVRKAATTLQEMGIPGEVIVADNGSSDDSTAFNYLRAYSPLHNIKPGTCYPPTLAFTADHDDRVVPGHTFKYVATLQAAQSCNNPILVRIETKSGHGAGRPTTKLIDEATDRFAFLVKELHMRPTLQ